MKRPLYSPPEAFSLSPFLSLLPVKGKIGRLEALTSSFYARYEKVVRQQKETSGASPSWEGHRRLSAEAAMLKQVLDWLAVRPEQGE